MYSLPFTSSYFNGFIARLDFLYSVSVFDF